MGLTRDIAEFVSSLDSKSLGRDLQDKLKACLVNGFGVALGSRNTPYYRTAARAECVNSGNGPATLLFSDQRTSVSGAAFINAALFHGRAQEDTCGTVHVGAIVIPMLTAMLESGEYPLSRLESALLAGYEVSGLFDKPFGRITAATGLRATPLYGTLGAAAAAGRMMGLDAGRMAAALANACSFTGGTLQSFTEGTDEWRYQVGIAARNGLTAALLARAGSVSAREPFEGKAGFLAAYVRGHFDAAELASRLGKDWSIQRVTFKPFPVCAFNQTPVSAALALRTRIDIAQVSAIRVRMNPFETRYPGMDAKGPFNSISGTLMSIPFCVATALIHGVPTLSMMTLFDDAKVNALVDRISLFADDDVPNLSAVFEIDLPNGTTIHRQIMTAEDFSYNRKRTSELVRRIGTEQGVSTQIYDRLEAFVDALPSGSIREAVSLFGAGA